jgi:hypothetical protein
MSNNDFKPIETPWGVMHLHKSKTVWYTKYDYCEGKKRDCWIAYHTSIDSRVDNPWCHDAIGLGTVLSEELAINLCLARFDKMELIRSGKFLYT